MCLDTPVSHLLFLLRCASAVDIRYYVAYIRESRLILYLVEYCMGVSDIQYC